VLREGDFRDANTTALVADIVNKRNTYKIYSELKMSHVNYQNQSPENGFSSLLFVGKVHGNLRYSFDHRYADTNYEINDLGLIFRNNFNNFGADISYQTFEPTGKLNQYRINAWVNYRRLVDPNAFSQLNFGARYFANTTKLNAYSFRINIEPGKQYDYFESRDGRPFIYENFVSTGGFYSSNYNNKFAIDFELNFGSLFEQGRDLFVYEFEIKPRFRFSDKFLLSYSFEYDSLNGDRGYATIVNEEPILGERNRRILENRLSGNYTFSPFHSLALTFRHYWDTVNYDYELFTLLDNGRLTTDAGYTVDNVDESPNINFSTWNIDLSYSWQFAPGSFLTALYRNQLFNQGDNATDNFSNSLNFLFDQPSQNTFSLRLQYFIDYNGMKSIFRKNKKTS
jgi:hypothetical protein